MAIVSDDTSGSVCGCTYQFVITCEMPLSRYNLLLIVDFHVTCRKLFGLHFPCPVASGEAVASKPG